MYDLVYLRGDPNAEGYGALARYLATGGLPEVAMKREEHSPSP
jgi:hypothetical protein